MPNTLLSVKSYKNAKWRSFLDSLQTSTLCAKIYSVETADLTTALRQSMQALILDSFYHCYALRENHWLNDAVLARHRCLDMTQQRRELFVCKSSSTRLRSQAATRPDS
jgi:hypothetical protein